MSVGFNAMQVGSSAKVENVLRDMRVRSLWSPYYFTKVVLGYSQMVDHLHLHDTELFVRRWASGVRKQWIEWPRGFFKSTTFTIGTGVWIVLPCTDEDTEYALDVLGLPENEWNARMSLHDQDATQLLAFETIGNAIKKVVEIKWHFEENQLFRSLFPEIAYTGAERPWRDDCLRIRRVGDRRRAQEGSFEAIGADGALQSRHYKIVWEDDLVGKKATESPVEMEKTIRWHGLLHGAFENASEQIRFGVSNRWGYNDLNGHIRKEEPDFVFYTRAAWELDEETGQDVAIFPERYPLSKLYEIRDSGSMSKYDFACQYLNRPRLETEAEVDLAKLHEYRVELDGQIVCNCGARFYPRQLNRYLHYDPYNAKGVRSTSCPAIVAVGLSVDKHIFVLDYFMGKTEYSKIYDRLFEYNDRWMPQCFTYEDVGHQNLTEFHIRREQTRSDFNHKKFQRIVPVGTGNRAKEIRIREGVIPWVEKGKVALRSKHLTLKEQLETFPFVVPDHDYDLLDALAQGHKVWQFPLSDEAAHEFKVAEDDYLAQLGEPYSLVAK